MPKLIVLLCFGVCKQHLPNANLTKLETKKVPQQFYFSAPRHDTLFLVCCSLMATPPNDAQKPSTTFAARAAANQGDIISCEPKYRINSSRRKFTALHEAILVQNLEQVTKLCNEFPDMAKVKDEGGNMPAHICAQMSNTPADICALVIEAYPEALVLRNNQGHAPGSLAMQNPNISRDVKNMMQDGRTEKRGNWVYDRYEKERHAHAIEYSYKKDLRSREADGGKGVHVVSMCKW